MFCRKVKNLLNRYLDGETTPEEKTGVERHLDQCRGCREALKRLRSVESLMMQLPGPPDVPTGFTGKVLARAEQRFKQQSEVFSAWKSFSPVMRIAAAVTLIIGLGLGGLMGLDLTGALKKQTDREETDPIAVYGFDYFSDAPDGSLTDAYLTLASAKNGEGE